ncbi:hypothetical protein NC99_14390 [Sunxiuqinia dokdonensis]|uniref:Uncharacterized protein n=1 Tax=Sunxiuqinia dokdonensis TaxID=1409788 RepID=A0A0L8VBC2_9BACT|nr:hypothetical protein NC99_14390 [Sunxiuqinia dokdonensis]
MAFFIFKFKTISQADQKLQTRAQKKSESSQPIVFRLKFSTLLIKKRPSLPT